MNFSLTQGVFSDSDTRAVSLVFWTIFELDTAVVFQETHGQYHGPKDTLINPIELGRIYPDTASTLPMARKRT
jgi:hypothetical protein